MSEESTCPSGHRAIIGLDTLDVLRGQLPPRALSLVKEWAAAHVEDLRVEPLLNQFASLYSLQGVPFSWSFRKTQNVLWDPRAVFEATARHHGLRWAWRRVSLVPPAGTLPPGHAAPGTSRRGRDRTGRLPWYRRPAAPAEDRHLRHDGGPVAGSGGWVRE